MGKDPVTRLRFRCGAGWRRGRRGDDVSRTRLVLVLIATIVASAVLGGVAVAKSTPTKVSACTKSKEVRVLGYKVKCHKGEKKFTWSIRGEKGLKGSPGPTGKTGATGPRGPVGRVGSIHHPDNSVPETPPADGSVYRVKAPCAPGELILGGGYSLTNASSVDQVRASMPYFTGTAATDPQGWEVDVLAVGSTHGVNAWALCAPA